MQNKLNFHFYFKKMSGISFIIILLCFVLVSGNCFCIEKNNISQQNSNYLNDGIAFSKNDIIITNKELYEEIAKAKANLLSQNPNIKINSRKLYLDTLRNMIITELELKYANNMGITVNANDLNEAVKNIAAKNNINENQLREAIKNTGMSWTNYMNNIKNEIIVDKLKENVIQPNINVTQSDIDNKLLEAKKIITNKYHETEKNCTNKNNGCNHVIYKKHIEYHVYRIFIKPTPIKNDFEVINQLNKLRQEILLGKIKFVDAAINYSDLPFEAYKGGNLGWISLPSQIDSQPQSDDANNTFRKTVLNLKPGEISKPFKMDDGYAIILLSAKKSQISTKDEIDKLAEKLAYEENYVVAYNDFIKKLIKENDITIKLPRAGFEPATT